MAEEGGSGTGAGEEAAHVSRPDAVVQAMRVLEVQEHLEWESAALERPPQEPDDGAPRMEDPEKALLRQMCNVSGGEPTLHSVALDAILLIAMPSIQRKSLENSGFVSSQLNSN